MRKIYATGFDEIIADDRPVLHVSGGFGNTHGLPEVHLEMTDPADGATVRFWVAKDELLAALLDPDPSPRPAPGVEEPA